MHMWTNINSCIYKQVMFDKIKSHHFLEKEQSLQQMVLGKKKWVCKCRSIKQDSYITYTKIKSQRIRDLNL